MSATKRPAKTQMAKDLREFDIHLDVCDAGEVFKTIRISCRDFLAKDIVKDMARVRSNKRPKLLFENDLLNLMDPMMFSGNLHLASDGRRKKRVASYWSSDGALTASCVTAYVGETGIAM